MKTMITTSSKPKRGWQHIDWRKAQARVRQLQLTIVKAYSVKDFTKVSMTQEQLVRSFAARALAIRQVTSNKGGKTPGIDGVLWSTPMARYKAIKDLGNISPSNYAPSPVKRIYIPKPNGEKRPLGIPTLIDRSYQALWLQSILPIAEFSADTHSYGFRPYRSCQDAVGYIALCLKSPTVTKVFVLEGDISKFFDTVSHSWLIANIPMNKVVLNKILTAGYSDSDEVTKTDRGFAQGGIISPTLANMSLDGLQAILKKFNYARYADDFVVLGKSAEDLEEVAKPLIIAFLNERGLTLHPTKTVIGHASNGFNFLGFTLKLYSNPVKKSGFEFHMFPSIPKIAVFCKAIKEVIKKRIQSKPDLEAMISELNPMLRGWANYYRSSRASLVFKKISFVIFETVWRCLKKYNRTTPRHALVGKYFTRNATRGWILFAKTAKGLEIRLYQMGDTLANVHVLIKGASHAFDPTYDEYFAKRIAKSAKTNNAVTALKRALADKQLGICPNCSSPLYTNSDLNLALPREAVEIHHILPKAQGGSNEFENLVLLHSVCHSQVTHRKYPTKLAAFPIHGLIPETKGQ